MTIPTETKPEPCPASTELRILCAESLGWKWKVDDEIEWDITMYRFSHKTEAWEFCHYDFSRLPDPEHNATDALALVHKAREEGWEVFMDSGDKTAAGWLVRFSRYQDDRSYARERFWHIDPSFCRAICLAWLKLQGKL